MRRSWIYPWFYLLLLTTVFGQDDLSRDARGSNLDRYGEAVRDIADSLYRGGALPDTICVTVIEHPADWVATLGFTRAAEAADRTSIRCTPPYRGEVLVAITDLRVTYTDYGDDDRLKREVFLSLALSVPRISGGVEQRATGEAERLLVDTIDAGSADQRVTTGYGFTEPRYIREESTSLWKKIAEPALVLGTTITMVVLLFTTRS